MLSFTIEYSGNKHCRKGSAASEVAQAFVVGLLRDDATVFDEVFHVYPSNDVENRSWIQTEKILSDLGMETEPLRKDGTDWLQLVHPT